MYKQVFASALDVPTTDRKDNLGDIRFANGKIYKYIQYEAGTGSVAGTAGAVVVYNGVTGHEDNKVTKDYSDGSVVAGVLVAAMTDGQYGWMQIKGFCTLGIAFTSAPVDGQPIKKGTADGAATESTISGNAEDYVQNIGIAIDQANLQVLLDCPW